jgi:hypothetical protein
LAYIVVKQLKQKYAPTDIVSKIELQKAIAKVAMNGKEDPSPLFKQSSAIKNMFKCRIDDKAKITIVMSVAPSEYT